MKQSVISELEDARGKLSAYAALLHYRLANVCVKAAPEALLSITVKVEGQEQTIESVARARLAEGRDDRFEIYPLAPEFLLPLVKGIQMAHPEFKLDIVGFEGSDEPEDRYIEATMPEVNDVRHDFLVEAVKLLSDGCNAQLEATFAAFTARLATKLAGLPADELDEAKDQLQQLHDSACNLCKQYKTNKEEEIEGAYKQYKAEQAEKEARIQETVAAHNEKAGMQMKFNPEDE